MSREIKFRAWVQDGDHPHEWEMVQDVGVHSAGDKGQAVIEMRPGGGEAHYIPTAIMQYTGLKDKNGVKIYEGDVIRWDVNDYSRVAPVSFEDGAFWMLRDADGLLFINDWLRGEYTVLGNIHENPELLGGDDV